ncbi:protein LYK5 [Tanacetum coccineum]|uniref:Protein LYK5 n=1 Tax=Tanacetum coccineum TaxID=301880 RepID=A0ABQ5AXY7_9ASTR
MGTTVWSMWKKGVILEKIRFDMDAMQARNGIYLEHAENGLEPRLPKSWVHPSYWLTTLEEMYRFKNNPYTGPDLWPPSNTPILLTSPDYQTPIGRPPKKRRKSVAELYDGMVKDGKLSGYGKTVTCMKCGEKGHNRRSCKGQRGSQSTARQMPSQVGSQSSQRPSQATVTPYAPAASVTPSAQSIVRYPKSSPRRSSLSI